MCDSLFGILARVRQPLPTDFDATACDAARHGPEILGHLMLIARDSHDPLAELCAVKALALSPEPRAGEALRRVCALSTEFRHPTVATVFSWSRERIAAELTPRLLGRTPTQLHEDSRWWKAVTEHVADAAMAADYTVSIQEPWEEAEFADGYYKEMDDLTKQFGDPDWET